MAMSREKKKDIAAAAALIYESQSHRERFDVNINRLIIRVRVGEDALSLDNDFRWFIENGDFAANYKAAIFRHQSN
jgi:hypothetical protein